MYFQKKIDAEMWTKFLVFQAFALFPFSSAKQHPERTCPILGPAWPYPRDLRSSNTFQNATASLDAALDAAVKTGKLPYGSGSYNRTAFSVTLFSGLSDGLVHEYHHTPSFIFQSKIGTRKIDSDSIYRIASVSKALTAYLLLIRDGEAHLNTAVADLIPELKRVSYNSTTGVLIDWTQVTVADLMSQMSPLGYDCRYQRLVCNVADCRIKLKRYRWLGQRATGLHQKQCFPTHTF